MAAIQAGARSGEEISSNAHLSPLHPVTTSYPHPAIGRQSEPDPKWSVARMLPPLQQSTVSSTRADANFSRVYPPALETHQLSQLQTESDPHALNRHHPNKRRRLSGTILARSQCHPLGFADSPEPRGHSDRPGHQASPRRDLTTANPLIKLLSDPSPHFGRQDWSQHAYAPLENRCCRRGCQGPQCSTIRKIARELLAEIDARFPEGPTTHDPHAHQIKEISDTAEVGVAEALEWALYRLRCGIAPLRNGFVNRDSTTTERLSPKSPLLPAMNRPSEPGQSDKGPYPTPIRRSPLQGPGAFSGVSASEERWGHLEPAEPLVSSAANRRATSLSAGVRNESPPSASQSALMLPSPTSLNLPAPPSSHSPTAYPPSAAHAAHLQDLQHQVSVKTLALQTLQREYDNLLQKLERMRTKCATLEKKFEVSDTEINSLTDEKERLEKQVETLEKLLEEAQNARDEARSASSGQASQYMKIMEMAGQLQAQAAEERKRWEVERAQMLTKLAESQVRDDNMRGPASSHLPDRPTDSRVDAETDNAEASRGSAGTDIESSTKATSSRGSLPPDSVPEVLSQQEIKRLEARVQSLETALRAAEHESKIVREAALALAGASQRMESTVEKAMTAKE